MDVCYKKLHLFEVLLDRSIICSLYVLMFVIESRNLFINFILIKLWLNTDYDFIELIRCSMNLSAFFFHFEEYLLFLVCFSLVKINDKSQILKHNTQHISSTIGNTSNYKPLIWPKKDSNNKSWDAVENAKVRSACDFPRETYSDVNSYRTETEGSNASKFGSGSQWVYLGPHGNMG